VIRCGGTKGDVEMEVILLERVAKLGQMGDVVRVKDGFARNFLLPRGKALRATDENRGRFETMKADLVVRSQTAKAEASGVAGKIDGKSFTVLRQASETGQLFGSVSPRDLVGLLSSAGFAINRNQIALNTPIKTIGRHSVALSLHPEIDTMVTLIVARNDDEAARIARGENVAQLRQDEPTEAEAAVIAAEAFFEPEAADAVRASDDGDETPAEAETPAPAADKA
jgi:large subunit ribosomal protein L9